LPLDYTKYARYIHPENLDENAPDREEKQMRLDDELHKNNQTLKANNREQKESNRVRELQLLDSCSFPMEALFKQLKSF
jgi:hypothetical protein